MDNRQCIAIACLSIPFLLCCHVHVHCVPKNTWLHFVQ